MSLPSGISAAFIGSGKMLVSCAERWLSQGGAIHGVISDCPIASAWCAQRGVDRLSPKQDQAAWLARAPFDYLFSIINHQITPAAVLALPRKAALNYHDAPLPRYAGFNATSWAIIDGQATHAITWHLMTADADGGEIVIQRSIDIGEDDTAFSLGAKCVEAGFETFGELVEMIATGAPLKTTPQGPREGFHLRSDRPDLGVIDLRKSGVEVRNFVRGLDLGMDDNWMCRPKLALPNGLFVVDQADIVEGEGAPGTVVAADNDSLTIAVGDGALRFSSFTTLDGEPARVAATGARRGDVVPTARTSDAATALDAALSKHERFWVGRLAQLRAPMLPDLNPQPGTPDVSGGTRRIGGDVGASAVLSALLTYVARTGDGEAFDLAFARATGTGEAYAKALPLRVDVDLAAGFNTLRAQVEAELATQNKRVTYARDAVSRYAALRGKTDKVVLPLAVRLACVDPADPTVLVEGSSITLTISETSLTWAYDRRAISERALKQMAERVDVLLAAGLGDGATPVGKLDILSPAERKLLLGDWQATAAPYAADLCVHQLFEAQVDRTPDGVAAVFGGSQLTYRELDERANAVAEALIAKGVGPDAPVAVCIERSLDLIVGLMGVLKAGGAYVPLDPAYPRERLAMMLEDSKAKVLLTQHRLAAELPVGEAQVLTTEALAGRTSAQRPQTAVGPDHLAYVIFTSGSTGRPKGVMVGHRNVSNFFTGMDQRIGAEPGVWLAVTSVSFDISVLELFWTLTRGFKVIIQGETDRASMARKVVSGSAEPMDFSLFYFAAGQGDSNPGSVYRLLLEGAKFADTHDFSAVWTPERHFHEFGGPYPNPAVTTAALATITSRVALRAGSVVLPLHNPMRVAEDWSVIDQLSGGRIGLSFASGWHANDFAFMPQNFERRREVMLEGIEMVQKLWRGEAIETVNGEGKTISVKVLPRPVQAMPPMWIASAGSVDTFKTAGRIGANVLTNMLGQDIDDLRGKFAAYRDARREAGHEGPGQISVMLHTFVCEDTEKAREHARGPFCNYLKSSFDLIKVAPFMFPAFRQPSLDGGEGIDAAKFNDDDMAALMEHAFDRYFETAGLFGSPENALAMVDRLKAIGANEVACLIDFGVDPEVVLESLPHLDRLRQMANPAADAVGEAVEDVSIADQIKAHGVTHLQCTPSMARMIASEPEGLAAMGGLKRLMLGGEALPTDLADQLTPVVKGEIHNMYGPTETTIWSTTARVRAGQPLTIGTPIANTTIRILDARDQVTPIGVPGELCIGGDGVVRGYFGRDDLTAERFVRDPDDDGALIYRTGDLARWGEDGNIQFLGRLDQQVKLNGYRIELGEIETVLGRHPQVGQVVVAARQDDGPAKLVAYVVASGEADGTERVSQWQGLWDAAYRQAGEVAEPRFNTAGWNDSATGEPIAREDMREWLDGVEASVLALGPKRVLEIGCGTGMVLYRVAPHAEHYTGVDLSPHALETIRAELSVDELKRVTLLQQPAHALEGVEDRSVDTVIINSVAQYFPDADYLEKVLRRASEIVSDGGRIFVGDVRSLEQLAAFHTSVVLQQAPAHLSGAEVARRIERRMAQDSELVLGEAFFHALVRDIPRLSRVEVRLKPGSAQNEMSAFRCDVVLHVAEKKRPAGVKPVPTDLAALPQALAKGVPALVVQDIANRRVAGLHAARAAMAQAGAVSALRDILAAPPPAAIDPAELAALNPDYDVQLVWARSGDPARFDAVFRHRAEVAEGGVDYAAPEHAKPAAAYANTPSSGSAQDAGLFDDLRAHAREFLPEYMVPAAFVAMEALPLTPNGKIDRKALPAPTSAAPTATEAYVAPSNATETTIVEVWKALLGVDRVGLRDNIFDLGANSLLTVQANQRLSNLLGRKVSLVSMFRYPTVEALAAHLGEGSAPTAPNHNREHVQEARKKDAAARRRELRAATVA